MPPHIKFVIRHPPSSLPVCWSRQACRLPDCTSPWLTCPSRSLLRSSPRPVRYGHLCSLVGQSLHAKSQGSRRSVSSRVIKWTLVDQRNQRRGAIRVVLRNVALDVALVAKHRNVFLSLSALDVCYGLERVMLCLCLLTG